MAYQKQTAPETIDTDRVHDLVYVPPAAGATIEAFSVRELVERERLDRLQSLQRVHFELFIWCRDEAGRHELDFIRHDIAPGQVLRVRPGQVHRWLLDPPYDAELILVMQRPHTFGPDDKPLIDVSERTASDLDAVLSLVRARHGDPSLSARGLQAANDLVTDLLTAHRPRPTEVTERDRIFDEFQRMLVDDSIRRTVRAHANALGCSTRTLARICEERAAASPKHLIDQAVGLEAQRRLSVGNSATRVASDLGFAELSQFTRFFSRVTGQTPSAFAKQVGAEAPEPGRT